MEADALGSFILRWKPNFRLVINPIIFDLIVFFSILPRIFPQASHPEYAPFAPKVDLGALIPRRIHAASARCSRSGARPFHVGNVPSHGSVRGHRIPPSTPRQARPAH